MASGVKQWGEAAIALTVVLFAPKRTLGIALQKKNAREQGLIGALAVQTMAIARPMPALLAVPAV